MIPLSEVRELADLTQVQVAERMGSSQTAVSRLERQTGWRTGTLIEYLTALGAEADLVIRVNGRELVYRLTPEEVDQ